MVVKGATKKILMDLGLPKAYAHLWANDITMDELVQMNLEETMKHLYRHDVRLQELLGAFEPEKLTYISFCRWGPASYPHTNPKLLRDGDETFINYISNFIERVKVREGSILKGGYYTHFISDDWRKDVMMDRWGQKNPHRLLLNYSDLPFDNKT